MSTSGNGESSVSVTTAAVPLQFPEGLRVLAVDDDHTCLQILGRMLERCMYQVTKCRNAKEALSLLREDRSRFDIILSDLHMPDINGLKLLEIIGLEMDMPVVMMSSDEKRETIMKGIIHGACDYMVKPVRIERVQLLWQHVIRKRIRKDDQLIIKGGPTEQAAAAARDDDGKEECSIRSSMKRRKDKELDDGDSRKDRINNTATSSSSSSVKKPRMVWTQALHEHFVAAVNQLGYSKAVPKKIVEEMNLPGLTRENVASHLQKFRHSLRRKRAISQNSQSINVVDQKNLLEYRVEQQAFNGNKPAAQLLHEAVPTNMFQQPAAYIYGDMDFTITEGISPRFRNLPPTAAAANESAGVHGSHSGFPTMQMVQTPYGLPKPNEISGHHQHFSGHHLSNRILSDDHNEAEALRAVGNSIEGNAAACYPLASSPMVDFPKDHSHGFPLPEMNAIYGSAYSAGQNIAQSGNIFLVDHNSFGIHPESIQNLGCESLFFGQHFDPGF